MDRYTVHQGQQLGPILAGLRRARGMSQGDLARALGVGQQAISQLERFPEKASLARLMRVLSALQVSLVLESTASAAAEPTVGTDEDW